MKVLFLFSLLISSIFACGDGGKSMIQQTIQNISKRFPQMVADLAKRKECTTTAIKPICNQGYKYWNSVTETHFYKGVYSDEDNLRGFLDVIFDGFPFSRSDSEAIKDILMLLEFTDAIDLFGLETLFDQFSSNNKGCFFNLMFEQNCDNYGEYDFLISSINSHFDLGDDVFLVDYAEGGFFNGRSGQKVVREPAALTYDQCDALMQLFEVSVYQGADRIIRLLDGI